MFLIHFNEFFKHKLIRTCLEVDLKLKITLKLMKNLNFLPPLNFLGQPPLPRNSKIGVGEASRVGRRNEL